jgi:hypothetical protein
VTDPQEHGRRDAFTVTLVGDVDLWIEDGYDLSNTGEDLFVLSDRIRFRVGIDAEHEPDSIPALEPC